LFAVEDFSTLLETRGEPYPGLMISRTNEIFGKAASAEETDFQ